MPRQLFPLLITPEDLAADLAENGLPGASFCYLVQIWVVVRQNSTTTPKMVLLVCWIYPMGLEAPLLDKNIYLHLFNLPFVVDTFVAYVRWPRYDSWAVLYQVITW